MGKMSELAMLISELRNSATAIANTADALEKLFGGTETSAPDTVETEPVTADIQPSAEDLTQEVYDAIVVACKNGLKPQAKALLEKYGADRFSAVNPADYEALLRDLEELNHAS